MQEFFNAVFLNTGFLQLLPPKNVNKIKILQFKSQHIFENKKSNFFAIFKKQLEFF